MNGRIARNLFCILLMLAVAPWCLKQAQAGPGGGTYYANSPAGGTSGTALRKFVDSLPGVGAANKNNLGSYIPIATPIVGKPGVPADGDYYEIGLVEYSQKMHTDLPKKTSLRGYVDLNPVFLNGSTAQNRAQYLGPLIIAKRDRPVRLKFTNMLPTGTVGNLHIPVDTTLMGAGMGPLTAAGAPCDPTTVGATCAGYTQNRATIHLHGGNSPWISDGTPHQWTAPAGEATPYKKGVGARDVPDMPASGDGSLTFYWTNQQSNRLMFYHDHSLGITRLNVYAGEAAGFLLTDPVEEGLITAGTLPNICPGGPAAACEYRYGIPLIIQDKTFVPQNVAVQDAKWSNPSWGVYGDLWMPHVYEPNQDPTSPAGANPFGRWDYGPWFWPPISVAADKSTIPDPSTTPEAFHDTPLVNGTAYPYLTVEPKPYRFRILNACNDRGLNLSMFYADPTDPSGKEVKMVPAAPNPGFPAGPFPAVANWPTDGRAGGVPDPATIGPKMIQIGSESGFLPYPVVHPNQPVNFDYNRRNIVVLNVLEKNLFMGPAERADVIIDFSSVPPGSTLILYNDAPAPIPAFDPRYDYYTGSPDQTAGGGAPSTLRGYGPNTRTIMQFRVAGAPATPFNLANLQTQLPIAFKATQPAPVVPQPTLPVASGGNAPTEQYAKIQDYNMTFTPIGATIPTTIPFQPKAIQELWDPYGRMNATLGVELPFTTGRNQTTVPMGYAEPATERIVDGHIQMWKITHNGVDTHPVHFHMFDVQVINRVGWDGAIRPPDDNELGWKETVRMNPLEDIVVALRPKAQTLPFSLPMSIRAIDPTLPSTALIATTDVTTNPAVGTAATVPNVPVANPAGYDYGYEYVWHCHILGHEENDFMRPVIFTVSTAQAPTPTGLTAYLGGQTVPGLTNYIVAYTNTFINKVVLQWVDGLPVGSPPSYFLIERDSGAGFQPLTTISYLPGYPPIYTDASVAPNATYSYRVTAQNAFLNSVPSNVATVTTSTWTAATGVTLTPSKLSPHVVGTNVQFVAAGSGATATAPLTAAYQYRFLLNGVEVQAYSNNNMWTLSDTTPIGTYTVTVECRTSSAVAFDVTTSVSYQIVATPIPPSTVATPAPGIYTTAPVAVTLTATNSATVPVGSVAPTIYYTTDGSIPTTATLTSFVGTGIITLNTTTTINYFARDINGNSEAMQTGTWFIHSAPDMVSSIKINGGASITNNANVTLTLSAVDPAGLATMQFSNTGGINPTEWSIEEPYAITKAWTLDAVSGNGIKTVYVRFRDKSLPYPPGIQYPAITASITLDSVIPFTTASPAPGTYTNGPISVTLTSNKPGNVYFTTDGSTPTTASAVYLLPIPVVNIPGTPTTIKYFAVDTAGNTEPVETGTWYMAANNLTASFQINGGNKFTNTGNVSLNLTATDPVGIATISFSDDNINYGADIPVANITTGTVTTTATSVTIANYPYTLAAGSDGVRTVYVKFKNKALPQGFVYAPITASITLDTLVPVTSASPVTGTYSGIPVTVSLVAGEPATIYYTTDGSTPTTASSVYAAPLSLSATTTVRYFAVDLAGNTEAAKIGTWTTHTSDMVASLDINNGATRTKATAVNLALSAVDPMGVATMQFSNDGVTYSAEEQYGTAKTWNLAPGDGLKTVYVKFRDNTLPTGFQYPPFISTIFLDTVPPITSASPNPGTYASATVSITLTANKPATIYYTTDGSTPTNSSNVYSGPLLVSTTTTVKYFGVDVAGNAEPVKSATWAIHVSDMVASVLINGGALSTNSTGVTLTLSAVDPLGVDTMQFSNDGVNYSAEEPYTTAKSWTLTTGDAVKAVYVRFRDKSAGGGNLYEPISATITLDTVPPVTTPAPIPGLYSSGPILVTLTASKPGSIVYYTTDGTLPSKGSTTFTTPITVPNTPGQALSLRYFAVDSAGNVEQIQTATWTIHSSDMSSTVTINGGATWTSNPAVSLTLVAFDAGTNDIPATMQFSNDGVIYSPEEPFKSVKNWNLDSAEGVKTVYIKLRDKSAGGGHLYDPVTATIALGAKDGLLPGTTSYIQSAARSLKIASGLIVGAPMDLVHSDVAPYSDGAAHPDGKLDLLDVYTIMLRSVGLISTF
jgi:FtsP/CotA-like multicopper oxidase with cupredoxin domain